MNRTLSEFVDKNRYFVVAHRGSSGTAPENTLSSFREAIEAGAGMVECDIQMTADRHIVVFHDKGLSRTTNGKGFAGKMNLDELRNLDAGSWFHPRFSNEKIPLLEEIIDTVKGKAFINIEVKNLDCDYEIEGIENILNIIEKNNFQEHVLFSSFYYRTLKEIKKRDERYHVAAIRIPKDDTLPSVIAKFTGCEGFVLDISELNDELSEDVYKNNIYVGVYSIDNEEQLDYALNFNINAIVTNYPAKIIAEMKRRKLIA